MYIHVCKQNSIKIITNTNDKYLIKHDDTLINTSKHFQTLTQNDWIKHTIWNNHWNNNIFIHHIDYF